MIEGYKWMIFQNVWRLQLRCAWLFLAMSLLFSPALKDVEYIVLAVSVCLYVCLSVHPKLNQKT